MTTRENLDWNRLDRLFDQMGQEKERPISQFWDWSRAGDHLATQTGLMILQLKPDFELDMMSIGGNIRQARRVSRHLTRVADRFRDIRSEFQKIPATIMSAYEAEIQASRKANQSGRNKVTPNR